MKFGFENRKHLTGADLAVRVMQIAALLPAPYVIAIPGYPALISRRGVLSGLFDLGLSALPRLETLGLSALYHLTLSELAVYFAALGFALILGIASKRLLERFPRAARLMFAALIVLDLVLRLIPLNVNRAFGLAYGIAGFAVRLGCLALILLDLRAAKQQ